MSRLPAQVEWLPAQVQGRAGYRLMVILTAPGCAYARKTGGCTNCGFPQAFGTGGAVSAEDYLTQVEAALGRIPAGSAGARQGSVGAGAGVKFDTGWTLDIAASGDGRAPDALVEVDLYNSGSYFNPDEVPEEAQVSMLALAAAHPAVTSLLVETRPEYVSAAGLKRAMAACRGKALEVGIGLESANPEILKRRIHKGYTWRHFAEAARLVAEAGARLLVYVLLKPMDTGEREAIEDSVLTAEKVFALGRELKAPTRVALEPCFVPSETPLYHAWEQGRYRPPWLWSVVEVVTRIAPLGPVLVGLSGEGMNPHQAPHNCELCTQRVREGLAGFNRSQDVSVVKGLDCGCREGWRNQAK